MKRVSVFRRAIGILPGLFALLPAATAGGAELLQVHGAAVLWTASSGLKVRPDTPVPAGLADSLRVRAARNESEAVQLVVTPKTTLRDVTVRPGDFAGPGGAALPASAVDVLRVAYVPVAQATDAAGATGLWPDPLPPVRAPLVLGPGTNQPFWLRVRVPAEAAAGVYRGSVRVSAAAFTADVPFAVEVYGFALPDRMTCQTAFGFRPDLVFRYHGVTRDADRRAVLAKYWSALANHHLSPYDPAPLDPIRVTWPGVRPPPSKWADWEGVRVVTNETAGGAGALALFDDRRDADVSCAYRPAIPIPPGGLRLAFKYRTALPGQDAMVSFTHHDAAGQWMSGRNKDIGLAGTGRWESFDRVVTSFPAGAVSVRLNLRARQWTDGGEHTGLTWFDDVSIRPAAGGDELLRGGAFDPPEATDTGVPDAQLRVAFDFTAWDRAMTEALDTYHFNTFRLNLEGLGGGTFEGHDAPVLRGFTEDTREYRALLASYLGGLDAHLRERGWQDEAFAYWFDEPDERQYEFVKNGFLKLKLHAPGLRRMLTEQPEAGLIGGPDLWCPVSYCYDHDRAEERRKAGEHFWWYVCCGPKAPYATLFIDHPGTALRAWLWQTFQRGIEGILVWETVYWTSPTAYPDANAPQNPWLDPMGWVSGGPAGRKQPWGNGDGRFLYPPEAAADGRPAAPILEPPVDSIRIEMLRDGIEDYEYLCILRRRLEERKDLAPDVRQRAQSLLSVPATITESLKQYSHDPAPIEIQRDALARAIVELQ